MRFIILTIALAAAPSLATSVQAEQLLAMGSKSGAVQTQDSSRTGERYSDRDHEGKRTEKNLSSKESGARKNGTALPEKKPRLKYRDEPRCSC